MRQLLGETVLLGLGGDLPGEWVCQVGDEVLADIFWAPEDGAVRVETDAGVWRAYLSGWRVLEGVVENPEGVRVLAYGGGAANGLLQSRFGRTYELFAQLDFGRGPWAGIDEVDGDGVLRAVSRFGAMGAAMEIQVTPEPYYREDAGALVFFYSALRVFSFRRPFLRVLSGRTRRAVAERALAHVLDQVG